MMTFDFLAPAGWGAFLKFGYSLLSVVAAFLVLREAYRGFSGKPISIAEVGARIVVAALMLGAVQPVVSAVGQTVVEITNYFQEEQLSVLERAMRQVLGATPCDELSWFEVMGLFTSVRGLAILFGFAAFLLFTLIKFAIIDVVWKVSFTLVALQAPLTIPLTSIEELGGLGHYWRNVLSIAIWPITFSLLVSVTSVLFSPALHRVADGQTEIVCVVQPETAASAASEPPPEGNTYNYLGFVGVIIGLTFLTLRVPEISALIVGGAPGGMLGSAALSETMKRSKQGAQVPIGGARAVAMKIGGKLR